MRTADPDDNTSNCRSGASVRSPVPRGAKGDGCIRCGCGGALLPVVVARVPRPAQNVLFITKRADDGQCVIAHAVLAVRSVEPGRARSSGRGQGLSGCG